MSKLSDIFRILYCGSCKQVWQMRGTLKRRGERVQRDFECPYCGEPVKRDYFKNPSIRALDPKEYTYPMWNNAEDIKFNRELLGLDPRKGLEL